MSNILRRASDAFHHRPRQDSTGSTETQSSPNAAKPPEQEPTKQRSGSVQSDSQANDAAGKATNDDHPKRRPWGWGLHGEKPEAKQQLSQEQRNNDWIFGS